MIIRSPHVVTASLRMKHVLLRVPHFCWIFLWFLTAKILLMTWICYRCFFMSVHRWLLSELLSVEWHAATKSGECCWKKEQFLINERISLVIFSCQFFKVKLMWYFFINWCIIYSSYSIYFMDLSKLPLITFLIFFPTYQMNFQIFALRLHFHLINLVILIKISLN